MKHRLLLYTGFLLVLIGANLDVVGAVVALARANSTASHIVLVPLVSLVLMVHNRAAIASSATIDRVDLMVAVPAMLAGVVVLWMADPLSLRVTAMVILTVAGFLVFFGRGAVRTAMFPLAFLVFAIPIPPTVLAWAVQVLKDGSANAVAALFTLAGVPFHRQQYVFSLAAFSIEIADECSGIRSSIALLLTMVLAGYTFLTRSWSRLALVALILPVAILKNGIRIVSLSLLAMYIDPAFLDGQLHHEGGIVFFLMSLAMAAPVLTVLRRLEVTLKPLS